MPRSEALQLQWALYDNRQFAQAIKKTEEVLDMLPAEDRRDAQQLLGLCHIRKHTYTQAVECLQEATRASSDAQHWANLAIAATYDSRPELGAEAFEQVRIIQRLAHYGQPPGYYHQLLAYGLALLQVGDHGTLQEALDELARAYKRTHTSDTAQLYQLQLPFLSTCLSLAIEHFDQSDQHARGIAWLYRLNEGLDRDGREQTLQAMRKLRDAAGRTAEEEL